MAASTTDFVHGIDPTGFTSITGAQLAQLVDSASPYTDKGLIVTTTDSSGVPLPPDATTTTKWQTYLWLRQMPLTSSFSVYAWNPLQTYNIIYSNSSGLFVSSKWNPVTSASIPANSITGSQIAPNTIDYSRIISVQQSQVSGLTSALAGALSITTTPAAGDISGSFSAGLTINNAAVTNAKLKADATSGSANAAVKTDNIVDKNVTAAKVLGGSDGQLLKTTDASNTSAWITPPLIYSSAYISVTSNGSKAVSVNAAGTDYEMLNASMAGGMYNMYATNNATAKKIDVSFSAVTVAAVTGGGTRQISLTTTTVDGNTSGANGYDVAAVTGTNWYYLWAIYDPNYGAACLLSLSSTAPTLPSGYIYKTLIGAYYYNTTDFIKFVQIDRDIYTAPRYALTNTAATTLNVLQSLTLTAYVPPVARRARGLAANTNAGNNITNIVTSDANGIGACWGGGTTIGAGITIGGTLVYNAGFFDVPIITSQTIYWAALTTGAYNSIIVTGYKI